MQNTEVCKVVGEYYCGDKYKDDKMVMAVSFSSFVQKQEWKRERTWNVTLTLQTLHCV